MNAADALDLQTIKEWLSHWILHTFAVVLLTLILAAFVKRLLNRLEKNARARTRTHWDEAIFGALRRPMVLLVWILGISIAAEIIRRETSAPAFALVGVVRELGVIATFTWFLSLLVENGEIAFTADREEKGAPTDPATVKTIGKLLRLSVFITSALVALQTLGFSLSGVLAFGGVGGIAVGFAAKDLLANFFGGLMIYLDRPFNVGDWINSPEKEIEGVVEDISWRLTRIRTFDKRPLYIPNAAFSSIVVVNPSRMTHRRIYETIGIRYEDAGKLAAILAEVKQMLVHHPEIDPAQTLMVNFNTFAPSSLDFFVYCFTHTREWTRYHEVKQDVLLKILGIVTSHGAEVAFPTSTVHLAPSPQEGPIP
ncbi:MAG: mechanosensitive ion channel [Deltaproteobacteria bacterium]|nr:mechanosensitive ion channel [Deltaproteobacteria bacterium]